MRQHFLSLCIFFTATILFGSDKNSPLSPIQTNTPNTPNAPISKQQEFGKLFIDSTYYELPNRFSGECATITIHLGSQQHTFRTTTKEAAFHEAIRFAQNSPHPHLTIALLNEYKQRYASKAPSLGCQMPWNTNFKDQAEVTKKHHVYMQSIKEHEEQYDEF